MLLRLYKYKYSLVTQLSHHYWVIIGLMNFANQYPLLITTKKEEKRISCIHL